MDTTQPTKNTSNTKKGLLNTADLDALKEQMQQMLLQNEQLLASFNRMRISTNNSASFPIFVTKEA